MKRRLLWLGLLALLFVTGCASTRQYLALPDQAKKVEDPTKGRVYVMRPASGFWDSGGMIISRDGKLMGETGPSGYLCWEQAPGAVMITGKAEGVSQLPLTVEAGQVYYIFEHVRLGLIAARNELELVDEQKGQEVLKKCARPKVLPAPPASFEVEKEASRSSR